MDPISATTSAWYYKPPAAPTATPPEASDPTDQVQLSQPQPELMAMQDLRNFARDNAPIPTEIILPHLNGPADPPKPRPVFQGKPPLPQKLDLHSLLSGEKVAASARSFEHTPIRQVTGKLAGFQDTTSWPETSYGTNNQCANFVSTFAQRLGLKGHYMRVADLEAALHKQGWKSVSYKDAQPGDVWISDGHTELVTGRKGELPLVTGSNNGGHSYQTVSTHPQRGGRFYTRPIWRQQH
jgi:hypothetical protein